MSGPKLGKIIRVELMPVWLWESVHNPGPVGRTFIGGFLEELGKGWCFVRTRRAGLVDLWEREQECMVFRRHYHLFHQHGEWK